MRNCLFTILIFSLTIVTSCIGIYKTKEKVSNKYNVVWYSQDKVFEIPALEYVQIRPNLSAEASFFGGIYSPATAIADYKTPVKVVGEFVYPDMSVPFPYWYVIYFDKYGYLFANKMEVRKLIKK